MPTQIGVKKAIVRASERLSQRRALLTLATLCLLLLQAMPAAANSHIRQAALGTLLQAQLAQIPTPSAMASNGTVTAIQKFYRSRAFTPAWLDAKRLMELRQLGTLAEAHGLEADAYRLTELSERIDQLRHSDSNAELARLELMATISVARLTSRLRQRKADPVVRYASLRVADDADSMLELLTNAARSESLSAYLNSLPPDTLSVGL